MVESKGYQMTVLSGPGVEGHQQSDDDELRMRVRALAVGVGFSAALLLWMALASNLPVGWRDGGALILTLPVYLYTGRVFHLSAWRNLRLGQSIWIPSFR